jgi:hypothetical protein
MLFPQQKKLKYSQGAKRNLFYLRIITERSLILVLLAVSWPCSQTRIRICIEILPGSDSAKKRIRIRNTTHMLLSPSFLPILRSFYPDNISFFLTFSFPPFFSSHVFPPICLGPHLSHGTGRSRFIPIHTSLLCHLK